MSNKIYEENNVSAIATSIRAKNGLSTTYKVADMSGAINGLQVLKENTQTQNPLNIKGIGCLKDYKVWGNAFQLPSAYQQVEYIQSTGTQYIDTGVQNSSTWELQMRMCWTSFSPGTSASQYAANGINSNMQIAITTTGYWSANGASDGNLATLNTIYNVSISQSTKKLLVEGVQKAARTSISVNNKNIYLFAYNDSGTAIGYCNEKVYSAKIYDNNVLVRDFIPCYRISDNVIGLYDIVGGNFYTNNGSGTFTKGNNTTPSPTSPVSITAVGEYENGKYKIDVVSRGKNLFDGTYLKKAIGGNSGKYYYDNANYRTAIIKCEPNTLYTITRGSSTTRFIVCDNSSIANDGTELDNQLYTGSDLVRVVETHSNSKYLYICVSYSNEEPTMQVEKGSKATTYERYRKNITPIYLDKPLYKIGNVSDYIDFANGKVYRYFGETTKSAGTYTLSDSKSNSNYMCTQQASGTLSGNSLTLATGVSSAKVVYQLASLTQENITLPDIPLFNNINTIVEVDNATGMYGKYWEIV